MRDLLVDISVHLRPVQANPNRGALSVPAATWPEAMVRRPHDQKRVGADPPAL